MKKYYFLESCKLMNLKPIKNAIIHIGDYNHVIIHNSCKVYGGINNYVYDQNKDIVEVKQFKLLKYLHYTHKIVQLIFIASLYIIPALMIFQNKLMNKSTGNAIIMLIITYIFYIVSIYLVEKQITRYRYKILSRYGSR